MSTHPPTLRPLPLLRGPVLSLLLLLGACAEEAADLGRFPVIPQPLEMEGGRGELLLSPETGIGISQPGDGELSRMVEVWRARMEGRTGLTLPIREDMEGAAILIRLEPRDGEGVGATRAGEGLPGVEAESYELEVTPRQVTLVARDYPGIFYGLETLSQLVTRTSDSGPAGWMIPAVDIDDMPRFPYRGLHLDVGRHFFGVDFIKRYLDLLAAYKMNVFHWHLTEDQGWRIEIHRYPRLTEVGSCRAETMVEKSFDPYVGDGAEYCGFYTQEEIREVVAYARDRFITVIPEIEMPGHSVAALAAYPELACTAGPFQVATRWGVTRDIYCPGDETFEFLENVLREVMALFPGPYIHIGGDEAPKDRWEESQLAQEVIRREGLADEDELQSWFIRRIETFLNEHGRSLVGWDEILEGGLAPNATVMSWRGEAGGIAAAQQGHDVIMSPNSHLYLDHYQGDTLQEPLAIGGFSPLEDVYAYDPIPEELTATEALHVLGAQGNVWTEYMKTTEYVEYMVLPRLLALSEVVWSPQAARQWDHFAQRLPRHFHRLDDMGVNYRLPDVTGLESDRLTLEDWVLIDLGAPVEEGEIRFTMDGTDPGPGSPLYAAPFSVALDGEGVSVAARVIQPDGRMGSIRRARFRMAEMAPAKSLPGTHRSQGLRGAVVPGTFASVQELPYLRPEEELEESAYLPRLEIPASAPEVSFGIVFQGYIRVPWPGIYTFFLGSDDGSRLSIGGDVVVDNDGYHSMSVKPGQVALHRGWHPLTIEYFQGGGAAAISLEVQGPKLSRRPVPASWLAHAISEMNP